MRRPTLPLLAVVFSTACGVASPEAVPADKAELDQLNQELVNIYDVRRADRTHFRPLCDAFGYPLVGNIASKGGSTASEFCALIRKPL